MTTTSVTDKKHILELLSYLKDPGRSLIAADLVIPTSPDVLASVFGTLAKEGVRMINSHSQSDPSSPNASWTFFAEVGPKFDIDSTRERVLRSGAKEFRAIQGREGFVWNSFHFPVKLSDGRRAVVVSLESMGELMKRLRTILGSGAPIILYEMGEAIGQAAAILVDTHHTGADVESKLQVTGDMYSMAGWGEVVNLSMVGGRIAVSVKSNFECTTSNIVAPRSHFFRGELAGSLGAVLGHKLVCKETKCLGGGGEVCEFILSPADVSRLSPDRER